MSGLDISPWLNFDSLPCIFTFDLNTIHESEYIIAEVTKGDFSP